MLTIPSVSLLLNFCASSFYQAFWDSVAPLIPEKLPVPFNVIVFQMRRQQLSILKLS